MKVERLLTEKYYITDVYGLDPITVFCENHGDRRGEITVKIYGEVWTTYFGSMGYETIQEFVLKANNSYMHNKMCPSHCYPEPEPDWRTFVNNVRKEVLSRRKDLFISKLEARWLYSLDEDFWEEVKPQYYSDSWNWDCSLDYHSSYESCLMWINCIEEYIIPTKRVEDHQYNYFCKVLDVVREVFKGVV